MTTADPEATNASNRAENTKPVTIQLRDELLQKLKILAILQESTVSDLLAESAVVLVKRDLKKLEPDRAVARAPLRSRPPNRAITTSVVVDTGEGLS